MFQLKSQPKQPTVLDDLTNYLMLCMRACDDPSSDEFAKMAEQLVKITSTAPQRKKIDPNALLAVAGNLIGIVAILRHEELNVITSKAFGLLGKTPSPV